MTVQQIYTSYTIPPNLQKHQVRVASLAQLFLEQWSGVKLDEQYITLACLFHDMANIIKFDFTKPPLFPDEVKNNEYWKNIQMDTVKKYGENIHAATLTIAKEIGLVKPVVRLIENLEWDNVANVLHHQDYESALAIYSDMRIGPFGILSLRDRLENLQSRNISSNLTAITKSAALLEQEMQKHLRIHVDSITDSLLEEKFERLFDLDV
jgi:hypothetical protein